MMSPVSPELPKKFEIDEDAKGVVITSVRKESDAAEKFLIPGDIIVEVNQEPVVTPADVRKHVDRAREKGRKMVLLLIDKKGDMRFIPLRIEDN